MLRQKTQPITNFAAASKLVEKMFEIMYECDGVGLAAPQVGYPYSLFIMNLTGDSTKGDKEKVFINPTIQIKGNKLVTHLEGCLSLPTFYREVTRPDTVMVDAFDLNGKAFKVQYSGMASRCVQHECNHLDGILFIDLLNEEQKNGLQEYLDIIRRIYQEKQLNVEYNIGEFSLS